MPELKEGNLAPDFSLASTEGKEIKLSDYRGKNVVLYFYPKDDTPGCTKEACSFRDESKIFAKKNAIVLGVSADSVESHQKFQKKYKLSFPLLSDQTKEVIKKYGAWKQKSMYGNTFLGIERTTVLIDKQGKVAKIFPKVKVDGHSTELLSALDSLLTSSTS